MRATEQLGRYQLLDLVTQDIGTDDAFNVYLWHAYDETLDRPVAIRVLSADDPRASAVVGAAQAAALVDDRRLLRVLDVLNLPATSGDPARVAVVSEWASGRNLERLIQDRSGRPLAPAEALTLSAEIARALAAGSTMNVFHGRLRPSSVFITDAGEVRIRGLAVDAALFGALPETDRSPAGRAQGDVDALGSIVYLLSTGYWPGPQPIAAPEAPQAGGVVLPPSQVRAAVPRSIDDVVARSVSSAARPRGVARVVDASAFATMIGAALDHVAPLTVSREASSTPGRRRVRRVMRFFGRLIAVAVAIALVAAIAWAGVQLLTGPTTTRSTGQRPIDTSLLTTPATPVEEVPVAGVETNFPITGYRSYDPLGDDNGNGRPDKRKGRESEELAVTVNDADPNTAWLTSVYSTPDLDGKGGVGLIIDLGETRDVQEVALGLVGDGTNLQVKVSDTIETDPALWTPLSQAIGAKAKIQMRTPRPVAGRYVLVWITRVPPAENGYAGQYQGGIKTVAVSG